MKSVFYTPLAAVVLAGCSAADATGAPDQTSAREGHALSWLAGCWQHVDGQTQETWVVSRGDLMFGHATTLADGSLASFEDLRIQNVEGKYSYHASQGGGAWVSFSEAERAESKIVFANGEHDFPQRIAYELDDDTLVAKISMLDGGKPFSFEMKPCSNAGQSQVTLTPIEEP